MKQKLILLHGALGSIEQLKALKGKLAESFDVHSLNFEGHGGLESTNPFSMDLFAQNVTNYLKANAIESASFFGYSMGGYVALNMALKMPEKVNKIYTLGTKFKWDQASAEVEVKRLNPEKVEEKVPRFAEYLNELHSPQDWKEVMRKTAKMMLGMADGARLFDADFEQIKQPVIIGLGSLDQMVSYEESAHVVQLLSNAKLVKLEGVEHPIDKIARDSLVNYIMTN